MQGEPVQINGVTTTAVVVRYAKSTDFGELSKFKKNPNLVTLKLLGNPSDFNEANITIDNKSYRVSLAESSSFGMTKLTLREV